MDAGSRRRPRCAAIVVASAALAGLAAAAGRRQRLQIAGADGASSTRRRRARWDAIARFRRRSADLSVIHGGMPRGAASVAKPTDPRTIQGDTTVGKVSGDAAARKFIHAGMTEGEVLVRIGRPDATAGGSRSRQPRWSYLPAAGDPDTVTTITFSGGAVREVTRKVVKR